MIDLHLHTTASDGRSSPQELVREAVHAGLTTIAVTDHDTVGAVADVAEAARESGLNTIPGIEITAVHAGRDVHILAYFMRGDSEALASFLERQRADRRRRFFEMIGALERVGVPVDRPALEERLAAQSAKSLGRPLLAQALVQAGHARSISDAFERYLGEGRPGYVGRQGASPREVIALVASVRGLTSLAHPESSAATTSFPELVDAGLPGDRGASSRSRRHRRRALPASLRPRMDCSSRAAPTTTARAAGAPQVLEGSRSTGRRSTGSSSARVGRNRRRERTDPR